jgi:hypothetical protein
MTNNWPDPERPGVPLNPEKDGWHWLVQAGHEMPAMWNATQQQWSQGGLCCSGSCSPKYVASDTFIPRVRYLGPCLTPADVEAIKDAKWHDGYFAGVQDVRRGVAFGQPDSHYAAKQRVIELEARIAEARRAGIEAAIAAAHEAWQDGVPPAEIATEIRALMEKKDG